MPQTKLAPPNEPKQLVHCIPRLPRNEKVDRSSSPMQAYEVESRYQRLEDDVQPSSAFEALDRAAQLRVNEVQAVDIDVIIAPGELGRYIRDGRQNAAELPEPWKDSY
jgi:hypothetical protein